MTAIDLRTVDPEAANLRRHERTHDPTKLRIARVLSRVAIGTRKCLHCHVDCSDEGLQWKLDLNEGIDLYIYLFGRFEHDVYAAYRKQIEEGCIILDIGANVAHTLDGGTGG